ncbi:MAG TPA: lamin tail domain-containing protein, partial [Chitinophagaceae bacterium]
MKSVFNYCLQAGVLFIFFLLVHFPARAQGRVVVNEFMAWSGCNTTSEYIELLNFGPGPVDIGCFIVTNGQYAVTIPPGTVLKPGAYYVLAGQETLARGCGNADSTITVDLNWNSCGCTDKPIPTTGDGFMKDGGGANEKVVLMDGTGQILDAVSRSSNPSASALLTTSGGVCGARTFDLDNLAVSYESIGAATGVDNSFARRVDGDCGWVKTTAISAGAPNKTGSTSSASYAFSTISASECDTTAGRVSINVSSSNVASLFPMS